MDAQASFLIQSCLHCKDENTIDWMVILLELAVAVVEAEVFCLPHHDELKAIQDHCCLKFMLLLYENDES